MVSKRREKSLFSSAVNNSNFIKKIDFKKKNLKAYIPRAVMERFRIIRYSRIEYDVKSVSYIPINTAVVISNNNILT